MGVLYRLQQIEDPKWKARLTTWLLNQHRAGVEYPEITAEVIEAAKTARALGYSEKVERFFLFLQKREFGIGEALNIEDGPGHAWRFDIEVWCECASDSECIALLALLIAEGFLHQQRPGVFDLTSAGYSRLEEVTRHNPQTLNAFVAMWFDASMTEAFEAGIAPAIRDAGYLPIRIDRKEHANRIDDEIIAEIRRAKFVVADFTCHLVDVAGQRQAVARGGVYYEAGFAQGLQTPVIWSVRAEQIGLVHFDTRQYAHIVWNNPAELSDALYKRIAAVIGLAPGAIGR